MHKPDQENTTFIIPCNIFCYKVMPFKLKNIRATYQRMITKMFKPITSKNMDVYIDNMVVKSKKVSDHLKALVEVFTILKEHKLRLNVVKCALRIRSGKFPRQLVTRRGIEANPKEIVAISDLVSPRTTKKVQNRTGMAATLNQFISKSSDKCCLVF